MKYITPIQPLAWQQVLGNASHQILCFTLMSKIKSGTQPAETSTLKFNLYAGSLLFTLQIHFLPCSAQKEMPQGGTAPPSLLCLYLSANGRRWKDSRGSVCSFPFLTLPEYSWAAAAILTQAHSSCQAAPLTWYIRDHKIKYCVAYNNTNVSSYSSVGSSPAQVSRG